MEFMAEKLDIAVIVNGQPTVVTANPNSPLHTIVPRALDQTGNAGQEPDGWEVRNAEGVTLELGRKIKDFGFPPGVRLFLNLRAGIGG
jgi:hypothetical protein